MVTITNDQKRFVTALILGTGFWTTFFYLPTIWFSLLLGIILLTILLVEWKNLFKQNSVLYWFLMPLYPILPFAILIYMNHQPCYRTLIYYLFTLVFTFDSGAYITGTILGSYKILPRISPGKTLEGCIGGYLSALVMFYIMFSDKGHCQSHLFPPVFVLMVCTIAFLGDVFESFLKRRVNIKDSGKILPGHGGFLDRFDAVMFAGLFFFIFRKTLAQLFCLGY